MGGVCKFDLIAQIGRVDCEKLKVLIEYFSSNYGSL